MDNESDFREYFALDQGDTLCLARVYEIAGSWQVLAIELKRGQPLDAFGKPVESSKFGADLVLVRSLFHAIELASWDKEPSASDWKDCISAAARGWLKGSEPSVEYVDCHCRPFYDPSINAAELARQIAAPAKGPKAYALV